MRSLILACALTLSLGTFLMVDAKAYEGAERGAIFSFKTGSSKLICENNKVSLKDTKGILLKTNSGKMPSMKHTVFRSNIPCNPSAILQFNTYASMAQWIDSEIFIQSFVKVIKLPGGYAPTCDQVVERVSIDFGFGPMTSSASVMTNCG